MVERNHHFSDEELRSHNTTMFVSGFLFGTVMGGFVLWVVLRGLT